MKRTWIVAATAIVACGGSDARGAARADDGSDWRVTGRDAGNTRYSPLTQIDTANVARLAVAWTYHTGDAPSARSEMQATPIVVDGVLYTTTPALAVVALAADSGTLRWRFDPFAGRKAEPFANRGVSFWKGAGDSARILFTAGTRLYALDARSGRPLPSFGDSGWVDLAAGLDREVTGAWLLATSPGVVFEDLLIQGTRVGEGEGSAPGHVRAYDVRTGAIRWTFRTIPRPGEPGHETWPDSAWTTAGGANSWAGMSVDLERGIVFVPTGSATPDFYGGQRRGANLFANSLLALDARTGARRWHFQVIHHDLWDRDLPAAPNLVSVTRPSLRSGPAGQRVDAVAQITKHGYVFLFDRESGRPLFPVEERPALASDLRGEQAWATQPVPSKPAPFARQAITVESLTTLTPAAHAAALARFRTLRRGLFTPPSREGTIVFPGFDGGGEWGGAAVDRERGVLYVNASDVPWIAAMREVRVAREPIATPRAGKAVFAAACASCHGAARRGDGGRVPSLVDVGQRLSNAQVLQIIERGRGFMPAFASLPEPEKRAVAAYVRGDNAPDVAMPTVASRTPAVASAHDAELAVSRARRNAAPYEFVGYERWRDSSGYPAVKPPWGTLSAIDLNTGTYRWRIPLGEHAALTARGIPPTGTEQYGGPIVTAGGLVFIAATQDARFRAFDAASGRRLWEVTLPAAGYATPATYAVRGRQYVVIAAGGGKLGSPSGDAYVAYALP